MDRDNIKGAVKDLETQIGFGVQGYMPGTLAVPERLEVPRKGLKSFLNWALKLHSKGKRMSFRH